MMNGTEDRSMAALKGRIVAELLSKRLDEVAPSSGTRRAGAWPRAPGAHMTEQITSLPPLPPDGPDFAAVERAAARLAGVAHRTPVMTSRTADDRLAATLFFK